jgi:translation initiation factor IF-2
MARKQVFKLAKELGLSSRDLLHELKEIGIEVKNNFSVLEEEQIELIRTHLEGKAQSTGAPQAEAESTEAPQPAEVAPATATAEREPAESQTDGKPQGTTAVVEAPPKPVIPEKPTGEPRPPVVAVLGHVDHGKTTLLDKIRQSHVAEQETGGITQSIGAYQVEYEGKKITFIDTPGHRAFTGMRARGAQVTDIVILVVAADDGVMEQTREAIAHAKAAGVPILVAINKIDKPGADVTRVKQQLTEEGLTPEDWGGDAITVPVSAATGEGIEELLEMIQLVAELEELRADPKRPAQGTIIESHLDTARGPVATAIIKDGTLHERDVVIAGTAQGRIRALLDDQGRRIKEAPPGTPVQTLGLSEVPPVGAPLEAAESPSRAKKIVEKRKEEERQAKITKSRLTWEDVLTRAAGQGTLKLILKADTVGSLEAVQNELRRLET